MKTEFKQPVRHIQTNIVKPRKYSKLIDPRWVLCFAEYLKKFKNS